MKRMIILSFLALLMTSCLEQEGVRRRINILTLGVLYQSAEKVTFGKKDIPYAWSLFITLEGKKRICVYKKKVKEKIDLRVVEPHDNKCSFNENIQIELKNLEVVAIKESDSQRSLIILDKNKKYSFLFNKNEKEIHLISESLCGRRKQKACYRGRSYKKNIITTCNQYNEEHFCAEGLSLYCNRGKYECL